jgi:diguanylate cyclase (GGDEF)-like protein
MKILLVEGNEEDKEAVQITLGKTKLDATLVHVRTLSKALDLIKQTEFDCVLTELSLPDGSALTLNPILNTMPFLILSKLEDESVSIRAIQHGFEDFLLKENLTPKLLSKSIKYAITRNKVKHQKQKKLEELSNIDHLTEVLNRRGLTEILNRLKTREETHGIILVDVDRFKQINDTYGYSIGDLALKTIADRLKSSARPLDQVARVGGDEFIVLVQNSDLEKTLAISERIRCTVEQIRLDCPVAITVSIGVAVLDSLLSVEELLKATQGALHRSKTRGKNAVCI